MCEVINPAFFQFIKEQGKFYQILSNPNKRFGRFAENCLHGSCFKNSLDATIKYSDLEYCQGFSLINNLPVRHSFNIVKENEEDRVLDLTAIKFNISIKDYFGITIPKDLLRKFDKEPEEFFGDCLAKYHKYSLEKKFF